MKDAWIVLYQMPEGILYTHGWGILAEPPLLPNQHSTQHLVLTYPDLVLVCVYDTSISSENAQFIAQGAYADGIFNGKDD